MPKKYLQVSLLTVLSTLLSCASAPENPFLNPDNAKINEETSLSNMRDSLTIGVSYSCSVDVVLPALVDSFIVHLRGNGRDSVLFKDTINGRARIIFTFMPEDAGAYAMQVVIVKNNGARDSLPSPKSFVVYLPLSPKIISLRPSFDTVVAFPPNSYQCTVVVAYPGLSDSFSVVRTYDKKDSMVTHGKHIQTDSPDTGHFDFSLYFTSTGTYGLRVFLYTGNVVRDSLVKKIIGIAVPQVSPVRAVYQAYLGDSITVKFHVVSKDSNLLGYTTSLSLDADSSKSHPVDFYYSLISRVGDDTISRTLRTPMLRNGLIQPVVCYAQAVDRQYSYSAVASCTVYVADTTPPRIMLLPPHIGPIDSIIQLPDSIKVHAFDLWGVDSVTLNGIKMTILNDTIAKMFFSTLQKGSTVDTIIAWDKARNTDTTFITLNYGGPPTYPPIIKNLNRSVREGRSFDTLFLDTVVTVTDPTVVNASDTALYRSSCTWIITDSAGNIVPYKFDTRKFIVPVNSDSEWTDTFNLNFKVIAPNGLSDSRVGTFMVNEIPDPPTITLATIQSKLAGVPFDTLFLDTCAKDPDNASNTLNWKFNNGKYFLVDSIMSSRLILTHSTQIIRPLFFTRRIAIVPDTTKIKPASWTGSDTLLFTVIDPTGLSQKKQIVFRKWSILLPPVVGPTLGKRTGP